MKKEAERESQILQKIKMKMDRIKATQQKILEPVHDPTTHAKGNFVGSVATVCFRLIFAKSFRSVWRSQRKVYVFCCLILVDRVRKYFLCFF